MADLEGDKSQEATPHRRQQAREEGHVARSHDLASAALLLVGLLALWGLSGGLFDYLGRMTRSQLGGAPWVHADAQFVTAAFWQHLAAMVRFVGPVLGLLLVAGVLAHLLQTGLLFLPDKLMPDASRISPLKGLARIFSLENVVRLGFGLFKIALIGCIAFFVLRQRSNELMGLTALSVGVIARVLFELLFSIAIKIALALVALAMLDMIFQRWKFEQDIRMTPQEVREEFKNLEGNPQILARRKQVQRQLAMGRVSTAVPKADVVVTNPTELAVAIQYDPETMDAPIVVAKGAGSIATRIRQLALEHGVPIVERKPLAQALFREVEVGKPIPHDKYAAVAEVLAYVYQLKGKEIPTPKEAA